MVKQPQSSIGEHLSDLLVGKFWRMLRILPIYHSEVRSEW